MKIRDKRISLQPVIAAVFLFGALGAVIAPQTAHAQCLPEFPGRVGNFVVCPDAYDPDRAFAALIQLDLTQTPPTESILDWGSDYTPFDGSRYPDPYNPNYGYVIRATCDDVTYTSSPVVQTPGSGKNSTAVSTQVDCFKGSKVVRPRPAEPEFVSKDQFAGTVTIKVPDWAPPIPPTDLPTKVVYPKQGYAYRLQYIEFNGNKWGKTKYIEVSGDPATKTVGDPKAIFNGRDVRVEGLKPYGIYHFLTAVLYDYGDSLKDCRFEATTSYVLEVNMASAVTGVIVNKPRKHSVKR